MNQKQLEKACEGSKLSWKAFRVLGNHGVKQRRIKEALYWAEQAGVPKVSRLGMVLKVLDRIDNAGFYHVYWVPGSSANLFSRLPNRNRVQVGQRRFAYLEYVDWQDYLKRARPGNIYRWAITARRVLVARGDLDETQASWF